ncbi:hypothetical protein TSOC_000736 [Tetrabaena socialis]|uniref:SGNH hydrolase-type esterase domain-containing protein n=1 Tax=Tetrabaena socialis TaxID=47790 RepID=A0A2J8AIL9_9CHLO|nr:hypothetical protein TSOC_000736 [Tetrabaena socialis]|eukprot:PNH12364.1 hypothetical protein TSOC_000736 [Tetrabaena socialis]
MYAAFSLADGPQRAKSTPLLKTVAGVACVFLLVPLVLVSWSHPSPYPEELLRAPAAAGSKDVEPQQQAGAALYAAAALDSAMMAGAAGSAATGAISVPSGPFFVAPSRPKIILFGDSLTERSFDVPMGWGSCVAANYTRKVA